MLLVLRSFGRAWIRVWTIYPLALTLQEVASRRVDDQQTVCLHAGEVSGFQETRFLTLQGGVSILLVGK